MKAVIEVRKLEKTYETRIEKRERDIQITKADLAAKEKEMNVCRARIEELKTQHAKDLEPLKI